MWFGERNPNIGSRWLLLSDRPATTTCEPKQGSFCPLKVDSGSSAAGTQMVACSTARTGMIFHSKVSVGLLLPNTAIIRLPTLNPEPQRLHAVQVLSKLHIFSHQLFCNTAPRPYADFWIQHPKFLSVHIPYSCE